MPNWNEILNETKECGSAFDVVRRRYLGKLHECTGRNVIVYYSGWLQKRDAPGFATSVTDEDKNGFMTTVNRLDREKGLDLVLHTPGGESAATESLVDYLRAMFKKDIRAIVPQLALSAGTMIACSTKTIVMGKQSSLGPVDPQFNGVPAHGVVEEFKKAHEEIKDDPSRAAVWQPIIARYPPAFIGECLKAMQWSESLVRGWLASNMLESDSEAEATINNIVKELTDHALTLSHSRHMSPTKCREIGLKITDLEDDDELQDAVLSVHHACMLTLSSTPAVKIIENHLGSAFIKQIVTRPSVAVVSEP